jgi:hypothetical protein
MKIPNPQWISDPALIGAINECRRIGEALLANPTLKAFAAYRRALTHLATTLGTADLGYARAIMIEDELNNYAFTKQDERPE